MKVNKKVCDYAVISKDVHSVKVRLSNGSTAGFPNSYKYADGRNSMDEAINYASKRAVDYEII